MKFGFGKSNKIAFGIFQDGLKYQLAELELADDIITIKSLEEIILSSPYFEVELENSNTDVAINGELNISNLDELNSPEFDDNYEEKNMGQRELKKFLAQFDLENSIISLNCENENINYFQFNSEYFKRPIKAKLKKELLSKEELKAKDYQLEYILNKDKSGLAVVHRGPFELLSILNEINNSSKTEKLFYSAIQTNEIALIDIIRNCYNFPEDEYVTVVYLGAEYKVGVVLKDNCFIKSFQIIAPPTDSETLRNIVYSKIILEQDNSNIPITQNVLLAGDISSDEDLSFFQNALDNSNIVDRISILELITESIPQAENSEQKNEIRIQDLNLDNLDLDNLDLDNSKDDYKSELDDYDFSDLDLDEIDEPIPELQSSTEAINSEQIAKFAVPIALAWKSLKPQKTFLDFNLLPTRIIEGQKYFKISWHGFVILAALFYYAFSGTVHNLEIKQEVLQYHKLNYRIENELTSNRTLVAKLNVLKKELNVLEDNMKKTNSIVGNRNQWTYILKTLSEALQQNPLSWLTSITATNDQIFIDGMTTNKRNIITFANLLPQGKIANISKSEIIDRTIWDFSLTFINPDKTLTDKYFEESLPIPPKAVTQEEFIVNKKDLYQEILSIYLRGHYLEAIDKFSNYIKDYPDYKLTYNAHYTLGESYYMAGDYSKALGEFKYILTQGGNKVPDALMMAGNVFFKTNQIDNAISTYKELIEKYPKHHLSKVARYKLTEDKYN